MHREINCLFHRGSQSELVHVVLFPITEDILAIARLIVTEKGKGRVVEVLHVNAEVCVLNLREIVLEAHKELSIICLCMVGLLAERISPATTSVTPVTFPSLCSPRIS